MHRAQDSVNTVYYQESREWSIESTNVIKETKIYGYKFSSENKAFMFKINFNSDFL